MNALADEVHKQEVPCMHTMICTPYHGHIIQQPSLHKKKFSANWRATATYVGMVEGSCQLHFGTNQCVQLKDRFTPTTFTSLC